mgnify:CR=1 FL=1
MRQIFLDTETTGLEHKLGHRVIEVGCVEMVNRRLTNRHFHHYLNPDRDIDAGAGIAVLPPGSTRAGVLLDDREVESGLLE